MTREQAIAVLERARDWRGLKNGELLALAVGQFDVLVTIDASIEHQQDLASLGSASSP